MTLRQFTLSHMNRAKKALRSRGVTTAALEGLILFVLALGTRLPFMSQTLHHWDSVNYALALEHYDVRLHQPQPPGYILYIALGATANALLHDPQASFVLISMLFTALAAVATYLLGCRMSGHRVGLIAALFLLASPSFWFYGEIAMPHALDAFLSTLVVYLAHRVLNGEDRALMPLAALLGIAGGVRQQTLVFLLPLTAYCVRKVNRSHLARAALILIAVTLGWLVPMILLSGGIEGYWGALAGMGGRLLQGTSVFSTECVVGLVRNGLRLAKYTAYGWNVMAMPVLLCLLTRTCRTARIGQQRWVLGLWIVPPVIFYLLIHMGNPGLVFTYLPGLMLASAQALVRLIGSAKEPGRALATAALIAVVASLQFVCLSEYPFGTEGWRCLTRQAIENRDAELEETVATIHRLFPFESSVVLATQWRHAAYYLPEYLVLGVPGVRIEGEAASFTTVYVNCGREYSALRPPTEANRLLPESLRWVVVFDQLALQWNSDGVLGRSSGDAVSYRELQAGEKLRFTPEGYCLRCDSSSIRTPSLAESSGAGGSRS